MKLKSHHSDSNESFEAKLNRAKKAIYRRLTGEFRSILPVALIRRVLNDAEELAHSTGFPALVFPVLAEEEVRRVSRFVAAPKSSFVQAA